MLSTLYGAVIAALTHYRENTRKTCAERYYINTYKYCSEYQCSVRHRSETRTPRFIDTSQSTTEETVDL